MSYCLAQAILTGGAITFGWYRTLSYLRYFQQEEYTSLRFRRWLSERRAYDTRGSIICLATALLVVIVRSAWFSLLVAFLAAAALLCIVFIVEEDPRKSGKLRLNMTQRASKIAIVARIFYIVSTLLAVAAAIWLCTGKPCVLALSAIAFIIPIQSIPYFLMGANSALWPAEKRLQDAFRADAQRILKEVHPFVIGVTGSYGKTGAKAALGELITQCCGATFWPKKSINTVMGITRDIRENMKPFHRYAVIEMGAYKIGSIKTLTEFTPPKAALVTAVGIMHLERFGSEENVYTAKSELPRAVPADGILVVNGDNPGSRRMATEFPKATTLLYGLDPQKGHLDCYASDIAFDASGTHCTIHWKGETFPICTPLLGRPALSNAIGAFAMACALGASPAYAAACFANLQPVDNRLVLDKKGEISFLRDAYNSNPVGFEAALEVLASIEATRRIVMTPGMVELGEKQFEENRIIATKVAATADLVIIVGLHNREALLAGLKDAQYPESKILVVDTRNEAFARLAALQTRGDVILIENDLGDLLEGVVRF